MLISTGYSIKPIHWDDKKRWVKRACPNYDDVNDALTRIITKLGKKINLNLKVTLVHKKGSARVTQVFKKWELISSHTCRRSFCTNMYLAGFLAEELMKISGHKSPSAFMRYIKIDNMQAADRLKKLRAQMKM